VDRTKEEIISAARKYLAFSEENRTLESEIAAETAEMMLREENSPGAVNRLSFDQRVVLAANRCIRHGYTAYDDRFIEQTIEQAYPENLEIETGVEESDEVAEFIKLRRR